MTFERVLSEESAAWVDEALITAEQRERLLARYEPAEPARSHVTTIIAWLGAAIVALGVTLVVATNWSAIPTLVKIVTGESLLVLLFGLGYWLRFGGLQRTKTGEAVLLVASAVFLGNLVLVSQQYHIETNPSRFFLALWLSVAALPYLLRSRAYALVSPAALVLWLVIEMARDGSPLRASGLAIVLLLVPIGAAILATGAAHRLERRLEAFAAPIEFTGGAVLFGAIYVLGFYRHFIETFEVDGGVSTDEPTLSVLLWLALPLAMLAAAAALATRRGLVQRPMPLSTMALAAGWLVVVVSVVWSWLVILEPRAAEERAFILWTGGFWLLALAFVGVLVWLAVATHRGWWVNLALVYLGFFVLTRYFDLFSSFGQTGLLFIGAGALLLAVAYALEQSRRSLRDLSERGT